MKKEMNQAQNYSSPFLGEKKTEQIVYYYLLLSILERQERKEALDYIDCN